MRSQSLRSCLCVGVCVNVVFLYFCLWASFIYFIWFIRLYRRAKTKQTLLKEKSGEHLTRKTHTQTPRCFWTNSRTFCLKASKDKSPCPSLSMSMSLSLSVSYLSVSPLLLPPFKHSITLLATATKPSPNTQTFISTFGNRSQASETSSRVCVFFRADVAMFGVSPVMFYNFTLA